MSVIPYNGHRGVSYIFDQTCPVPPSLAAFKFVLLVMMVIDHVDLFFPGAVPGGLATVGFMVLPGFAVVVGSHFRYFRDRDLRPFVSRLFIFASISQLPFWLLGLTYLNVLFTLGFGALLVYLVRDKQFPSVYLLPLLAWAVVEFLGYVPRFFDGGSPGLLLVFSGFLGSLPLFLLSCFLVYPSIVMVCSSVVLLILLYILGMFDFPRLKMFYYWFYPMHLFILWGTKCLFS